MQRTRLCIATRESPLALWQANYIKAELQHHHPGLEVDLLGMTTRGDRILDTPLNLVGGKGLFVKELEQVLLDGRADFAVHSTKDMPMHLPEGLMLSTICQRHEPRDALVSNSYKTLDELPENAIVGTSSLRRACQLKAKYPHFEIRSLRGNLNTRLKKLDEGQYDAIILAAAGLERLNLHERIQQALPTELLLPAVGQGVLSIECRNSDIQLMRMLSVLEHSQTRDCVLAERALSRHLGGSCQVPLAGYATIEGSELTLQGLIGQPDGQLILRAVHQGPRHQAEMIGITVAKKLLEKGADKILEDLAE